MILLKSIPFLYIFMKYKKIIIAIVIFITIIDPHLLEKYIYQIIICSSF